MKKVLLVLSLIIVAFIACRKDEEVDDPVVTPPPTEPISPVVFDPAAVPYATLSEYNFFTGPLADQQPVYGVVPFSPISTLFTDYAHKNRFIWMPEGVKAQYVDDRTVLDFPDGTVLIKNFYYDHVQPADETRILETRILFKRNGQFEFADYVWNAEQTEAVLDLNGSYVPLSWIDDNGTLRNVNYRIPSEAECRVCHKNPTVPIPIGPKPQNLNADFPYPEGSMNQLAKFVAMGYLESYPSNIVTTVKWDDPSQDLELRVRSYLDANCSHCHAENRHCDYRPMRFAFSETVDPVNLGVCVPPDDPIDPSQTHIVSRGNPARSMMYFRMNSAEEAVRMPLFGRTLIHQEAVDLVYEWISSLSPPCE
ncbi:MAG: hypothetical protein ABI432_15680 [Flavobacteriales bacterium]